MRGLSGKFMLLSPLQDEQDDRRCDQGEIRGHWQDVEDDIEYDDDEGRRCDVRDAWIVEADADHDRNDCEPDGVLSNPDSDEESQSKAGHFLA